MLLQRKEGLVSNTVNRRQPQLKKRTSSFSYSTIRKAVTHHQVANLEQDQIEAHSKFAESIKQKKLQSTVRVNA